MIPYQIKMKLVRNLARSYKERLLLGSLSHKKQIIRKPLKRYEGTLQKFKMYRVLIPIKVGPPLVVPTLAPCPLQEFNPKTMA